MVLSKRIWLYQREYSFILVLIHELTMHSKLSKTCFHYWKIKCSLDLPFDMPSTVRQSL